MKSFLELELIDEKNELVRTYGHEVLGSKVFKRLYSTWVAEIGSDGSRRFLPCNKDFSRANSTGTRGIFAEFILGPGKIYEVKNVKDRYFCQVGRDGSIQKITKEEVNKCLSNHSE
jgi:hypothetical protein